MLNKQNNIIVTNIGSTLVVYHNSAFENKVFDDYGMLEVMSVFLHKFYVDEIRVDTDVYALLVDKLFEDSDFGS